MPNPHAEYLEEKHSLADLKSFCRENKIKGFSGLGKKALKDLIYKHGETMVKDEPPPSPVEEIQPKKMIKVKSKKSKM